jgi:hypothetical protein
MARKYGVHLDPAYKVWSEMKQRCNNPNKWQFRLYGGRGITYCKEWEAFAGFIADMGPRPDGATLDRINVDGNYEPANCRWADKITQANNASSNRKIVVEGETLGLCEASRKYGVPFGTIWKRLDLGWQEHDAATIPVRAHKAYERRTQSSNLRAEGKAL